MKPLSVTKVHEAIDKADTTALRAMLDAVTKWGINPHDVTHYPRLLEARQYRPLDHADMIEQARKFLHAQAETAAARGGWV